MSIPWRSVLLSLILVFCFAPFFLSEAVGDTVYLKDGRIIEGIVRADDGGLVKVEFQFGIIEFNKAEVARIERLLPRERKGLREKWDSKQSPEPVGQLQQESLVKERKPKMRGDRELVEHISVNAKLNNKVPVKLLLDTGASYLVLSTRVGRQLGVDTTGERNMIQLQIGDGRRIQARYMTLKSVNVQGVEATNVGAAVLLDEKDDILSFDGVLGMSFLGRYNFKVDYGNKRLIFEEQKVQAPENAPQKKY